MAKAQKKPDRSQLPCHYIELGVKSPLRLECGKELGPFTIAYQSYGTLNPEKSNAILICHALTGDQFAAETHPVTGKPGWWENVVGPGKPVDTNKYFVICSNVLGGCMGSTGPASPNPATGKPYGLDFPVVTISDMVDAQKMLVDALGIEKLFCVMGGSMGGMQVLKWAARYPDYVAAAVPIATAVRHSAQNIAFHEVGRQAIIADPSWNDGNYSLKGDSPRRGLAVARMAAHVTYLSEQALQEKFGRRLQDGHDFTYGFGADFQVESYLRHQGSSFVDRFDANSYLYITRAMDYFDLARDSDGHLANVFRDTPVRFCILSFTSDWAYPTSESLELVHALNAAGANVSFVEIESDRGHDAFLLNIPKMFDVLRGFLGGTEKMKPVARAPQNVRVDHKVIADMVAENARVFDIGCCDGELLSYLIQKKGAGGMGLEISHDGVEAGVSRGLSIVQGDANTDLSDYPDNAFDYAILSHTLQAMKNPKEVLENLVRIGKYAIVSFPNFGHWKIRSDLFFRGRMPVNKNIPYQWWDTPNIHFCTIRDFNRFCKELDIAVHKSVVLNSDGARKTGILANILGEQAVYLLSKP